MTDLERELLNLEALFSVFYFVTFLFSNDRWLPFFGKELSIWGISSSINFDMIL